ncbi:MAG: lytic transglycosylase domain-containing protein [Bryobacteraceae bacterium]|jgi:soluble lytic murein transglycosylase-like protein
MRFCLILGCWLLPALAAENAPPAPAPRIASVVRVDARSGKLVRTVAMASASGRVVSGAGAWAELAAAIDGYVGQAAQRYEVDPLLVRSVIEVESNYNPSAVSPKGAQGLMQLMPQTARRFDVKNSFNPWENIDGGVRYLKYLLNLYGDREAPETLALAAYNAGEAAVLKHGGVPPYQETTEYVRKVAKSWKDARAAAGIAAPAPAASEYPPVEQYTDARGVLHIRTRSTP